MNRPLTTAQVLVVAAAVAVALVLQTTVLPHLAWRGVAPDAVLLVVVAVGLARGAHAGVVVGFVAGLLLDLAPPADHVAGRWALALLVVGYVAGRVRVDTGALPGPPAVLATVAACSFLGTSLFALTGLVLSERSGVGELLPVVLTGVVVDVVLAVLVLPLVLRALQAREPEGLAAR